MNQSDEDRFDFEQLNVKPSNILKKVFSTIHQSLSIAQVNCIKHELVSEDIFSPNEAEDCVNSGDLLKILRIRSEEQIGKALNIICKDPTSLKIIQAVKKEIQATAVTTNTVNLTPSSNSKVTEHCAMNSLVTDGNNLQEIVSVLEADGTMAKNWGRLATALRVNANDQHILRAALTADLKSFYSVLTEVLTTWAGRVGNEATINAFCEILYKEKFKMCGDQLTARFSSGH